MRSCGRLLFLAALLCAATALASTPSSPIVSVSTWTASDPTRALPLNHRGVVRMFRIDADDVTLVRGGQTPRDIALNDELADGFFALDPGPLAAGETLSLTIDCAIACDGEPFEGVVGDFVDEASRRWSSRANRSSMKRPRRFRGSPSR